MARWRRPATTSWALSPASRWAWSAPLFPWNFPLLMAAWKLAPALACGNSVVLKPSEKSPLSVLRLTELVAEAGIPDGVFNVVPGFGKEAGEPLALHMDVDGLVFTGSTAVGKRLLQCAGLSNMKRAYMECGGKSPNVVFADAPDLDKAAEAAAMGIFYNQGEVCTAASRLLVERGIKDEFVARVVEAGRKMQPRHPLEPGAPMGAMVDEGQTRRVLEYIARGQAEGARLAPAASVWSRSPAAATSSRPCSTTCALSMRSRARRSSARCWR